MKSVFSGPRWENPGGKDRTISFQRGEQRKVVEKKIDRIIYQVSDGSV